MRLIDFLKVMFKRQSHTKKCNIYYIMDLIEGSFKDRIPEKDDQFMEDVMEKCEVHLNCTNFVNSLIAKINQLEEHFNISKLVNTNFEEFQMEADNQQVCDVMKDLKMIYFCVGSEYLQTSLKPA